MTFKTDEREQLKLYGILFPDTVNEAEREVLLMAYVELRKLFFAHKHNHLSVLPNDWEGQIAHSGRVDTTFSKKPHNLPEKFRFNILIELETLEPEAGGS